MIFIGIDVTKDKLDCFIICNFDGKVLCDCFTISTTLDGLDGYLRAHLYSHYLHDHHCEYPYGTHCGCCTHRTKMTDLNIR